MKSIMIVRINLFVENRGSLFISYSKNVVEMSPFCDEYLVGFLNET